MMQNLQGKQEVLYSSNMEAGSIVIYLELEFYKWNVEGNMNAGTIWNRFAISFQKKYGVIEWHHVKRRTQIS